MLARTPLTDAERRRLHGMQDAWLARKEAKKEPPKVRPAKLNKDRRKHLVRQAVAILMQGEPTRFAYEGACRQGLRSALCLQGYSWAEADAAAADIMAEAFCKIGAKRPTWIEGQPEHAQEGHSPVERTRCKRCGGKIPETEHRYGYARRYCSSLCASADYQHFARVAGEKRGYAVYWAELAAAGAENRAKRERPCEWCGTDFIPRSIVEGIRFCSQSCAKKSLWAEYRKKREKPCENCGKPFNPIAPGAGKRFCSKACFDDHKAIKPKPCEWCETLFTPQTRRIRFCSPRCSARARVANSSTFICEAAE